MSIYANAGDLLSCYPGRQFRMYELVRHVSKGRVLPKGERAKYERGIQRAMRALAEHGLVEIVKPEPGRYGDMYVWRPAGQMLPNDNIASHIR